MAIPLLPFPCAPVPQPPALTLPFPFALVPPALPKPTIALPYPCCIQPNLKLPPIPIPIGPLVCNPAFVATLRTGLALLEQVRNSIPKTCPRV